jgi:dihydrolipoamide dehydrogenase
MRVAVVERDRPGGVCLNWGCIPSKALLNSAAAMDTIRGASKEHGIEVGEVRFDFKKVIARSRAAAEKLSKGVLYLLKKNKIDYFEAAAVITGPHCVALAQVEGKPAPQVATLEAERILIAAGSGEKLFPGMKVGDGVITSKEALVLGTMPASVVVIGAGAIGLEFGYFYSAFGAKVTIVELEKQMLPGIDAEVAEELRRAFVKRGVTVMLGHGYKSMARKGGLWSVAVTADGAEKSIDAEVVLIAVGRTPLSQNIGLEKIGVELERGGFIKINDSFQTTVPSIYSIGDVVRPPLLAHKASAEGIAAVEIMAGVREPGFDLLAIPGCIYCEPEVATVGLSEADAKARGIEVKVGKFPFRAIGKAVAIGETAGFVKIVATKQYGEVIGCQIIGHAATDIISEVVLGKTLETTVTEIGKTAHPHPTMSEAIMQAALAADGEAIDF